MAVKHPHADRSPPVPVAGFAPARDTPDGLSGADRRLIDSSLVPRHSSAPPAKTFNRNSAGRASPVHPLVDGVAVPRVLFGSVCHERVAEAVRGPGATRRMTGTVRPEPYQLRDS